ncbi:MAG TPA: type II toxin-antitoxin system prevent-host-death family antitoxin [Thermoanaerobaculia bacterium]|jgi:prevent-host-death family protein|nr:type II toxin-antitoxin system prevent-host-death family antitoxin [Thermoanaerobaculia bacterium]
MIRNSQQVNIGEARTRLSQLIDRALEGDEIIIARAGRPVARLVAWKQKRAARKPGRLRGRIRVRRTFDEPLPSDLFQSDEP